MEEARGYLINGLTSGFPNRAHTIFGIDTIGGVSMPRPTKEFLYQSYVVERRRILDIAREAHCRNQTIIDLLREYGFSEIQVTKEWMTDQYITQQKSVDEIAQLLQRDESTVRYYLRQHGIPIRYKSRGRVQTPLLHDRDWLFERYITQGLSTCQIGDELNVQASNVQVALQRHHIPIRPVGKPSPNGRKYTYHRSFSHRKRRLILRRDNHQCQWCGSTTDLEIHHIIPSYSGGSNDLDNGITLCIPCHQRTLRREGEFAPLFQTILYEKQSGVTRSVSTPLQLRLFF